MKRFIYLILYIILFTEVLFANTSVIIRPKHPADKCEFGDSPYINSIRNIQATEDLQTLNISFKTSYYDECINGIPVNRTVTAAYPLDFLMDQLKWPWTKRPFEETLRYDNKKNILYVHWSFDKIKGFQNNDTRLFEFVFSPKSRGQQDIEFLWQLGLRKINPETTELIFSDVEI